jgi:hypothetical protein
MEPSPDDPEPETLTQPPSCINPREERGAGGPTSSPAVCNQPPELGEHESSEERRELLFEHGRRTLDAERRWTLAGRAVGEASVAAEIDERVRVRRAET